jgi:hypothetical protein
MLYLAYLKVVLKHTGHAKAAHPHDYPSCKCAAFLFVGETCHFNLMTLAPAPVRFYRIFDAAGFSFKRNLMNLLMQKISSAKCSAFL